MKEIDLTQGKKAIVDDEDFEWLSQWKWCYDGNYAVRHSPTVNGKRRPIWMHREIMKTPEGMETDHRDMDKINNRKENLRICLLSENQRNRVAYANNTSGYKGVTWNRRDKEWRAQITVESRIIQLGGFRTAEEAALAYDEAALKYHGEFARGNFND